LNWIRLQSEYFRHRKTLRLVRRLGEVAALYPIRLWTWAVEQSLDGSLRDIDAEELAMICGFQGEAETLWAAMVDCGFVELEDGRATIRSWDEHQGKLIDRAERNAGRMRAARSRNVPDTSSATDVTNERNERNERNVTDETKAEAGPDFPAALDTDAFRAAWELWRKYRAERHLSAWKPLTIRTQLAKLAEMGEARALAAIDHSIAQAYQGIYEPKSQATGGKGFAPIPCARCGGKGSIPLATGAWGCTEPCKRCQGTGIAA